MTGELGYTHSMFSHDLRAVAVKFDSKEEGGNNNGLVDGNEISLFTAYVKRHYNYDFDFERLGLKQSTLRTVNNKSRSCRLSYHDAAIEIANKYGANGMNSLIAEYLNKDNNFMNDTANIAYLSETDMKMCEDKIQEVEAQISRNIENEKNQPKKNDVEPRDNLDRGVFRLIDWLFGR